MIFGITFTVLVLVVGFLYWHWRDFRRMEVRHFDESNQEEYLRGAYREGFLEFSFEYICGLPSEIWASLNGVGYVEQDFSDPKVRARHEKRLNRSVTASYYWARGHNNMSNDVITLSVIDEFFDAFPRCHEANKQNRSPNFFIVGVDEPLSPLQKSVHDDILALRLAYNYIPEHIAKNPRYCLSLYEKEKRGIKSMVELMREEARKGVGRTQAKVNAPSMDSLWAIVNSPSATDTERRAALTMITKRERAGKQTNDLRSTA